MAERMCARHRAHCTGRENPTAYRLGTPTCWRRTERAASGRLGLGADLLRVELFGIAGALALLRLAHVLQRVAVEDTDEGIEGIIEELIECRELALGSTLPRLRRLLDLETHGLHRPDDVADANVGSRPRKTDAAMTPAHRLQEAGPAAGGRS